MSIQWKIAAGFLYVEIAIVLLLVLPIASPKRWQRLFRSRILNTLGAQTQFYFFLLLAILGILLLDAIREMNKYNGESKELPAASHHAELQLQMKLFRAQRNFYISGFALFLSLVIRRLVSLLSSLAAFQAQSEASLRQAQSASQAAETVLAQSGAVSQNSSNEAHDKEVTELKSKIEELKKTLEKEKSDKNAIKKQAESTNLEYDRLTNEFSKLQKKLETSAGGDDKKDD